jgi:hypothetical protein
MQELDEKSRERQAALQQQQAELSEITKRMNNMERELKLINQ